VEGNQVVFIGVFQIALPVVPLGELEGHGDVFLPQVGQDEAFERRAQRSFGGAPAVHFGQRAVHGHPV
jgi:hypothetical protein